EVGLLGSHDIANAYAAKGVEVVSYLNLDQSGYIKAGTREEIGIFVDYTTKAATTLLSATVAAYAGLPQVGNQQCGYECTDNAAWYSAGYNSAMAFEGSNANAFPYNDKVNSDGSPLDTLSVVSVPHVAAFAKSTIGFIVELALAGSSGPVSTTTTTTSTVKQSSAITSTTTTTTTTKVATSVTTKPPASTTTTTTVPTTNNACYPAYSSTGTYISGSVVSSNGFNYVLNGTSWTKTGACNSSLTTKCYPPYSSTGNYVKGSQASYQGSDYTFDGTSWINQGVCA
ncbi:UNVERIFIED_CONTAM: Leucine aminopeptidase 1, partial [Siphonaria sp. JEL0065]